mgnify:FL=1
MVLSPLFTLISLELRAGNAAQARQWLEETRPVVEPLKMTHHEFIEAGILEAEVLVAEGQRDPARSAASEMLNLLNEHLPGRQDWINRCVAILER